MTLIRHPFILYFKVPKDHVSALKRWSPDCTGQNEIRCQIAFSQFKIVPVMITQHKMVHSQSWITAHTGVFERNYRIRISHKFFLLFMWKTVTFKMPQPVNQLASLLAYFN